MWLCGCDVCEDVWLRNELELSVKDCVELFMIVDLECNDFGCVCVLGLVWVENLYVFEVYLMVWY